jgi:hypothetical protein
MSVIVSTAIKTGVMTAMRDYLAGGTLELQAANDDVLAIFTLTETGGTVSTDTWTIAFEANTVNGESVAAGGTAATKARFKNAGGTVSITGLTVALSSADIILDNTSIASGQDVTISSATIQHPADPS